MRKVPSARWPRGREWQRGLRPTGAARRGCAPFSAARGGVRFALGPGGPVGGGDGTWEWSAERGPPIPGPLRWGAPGGPQGPAPVTKARAATAPTHFRHREVRAGSGFPSAEFREVSAAARYAERRGGKRGGPRRGARASGFSTAPTEAAAGAPPRGRVVVSW